MTTESDGSPPILLRFTLTDAEVRTYWRASAARPQHAARGSELSWMAYFGAFPVGLLGGFIAIAFGIDPHAFGGLVAMLVGLGYISGYYVMHIAARRFWKRLAAVDRQKFSELGEERTVEFTREGLVQAHSSFRWGFFWSMIHSFTRHENVLIFWFNISQGIVVPKRVLAPNEEAGLLELAVQHIGAKA